MKTILFFFLMLFAGLTAGAQVNFSFNASQVDSFTAGGTNDQDIFTYPEMLVKIKNNGIAPVTLHWQLLTTASDRPCQWTLLGICDNFLCYGDREGIESQTIQEMRPILPGDSGILYMRAYVLATHPDGIGDFNIRVFDAAMTQVDTVFLRMHKGAPGPDCAPTSASTVSRYNDGLKLFPNPATDRLNIEMNPIMAGAEIRVYDIAGRVQMTASIPPHEKSATLDICILPQGIYFLKIVADSGRISGTQKFVKQ